MNYRATKISKIIILRKTQAFNNSAGFTLIETLVSVALLGIILMVVTNLFAGTLSAGKQALDYQKLADELRNTVFIIEKEVNNGNGIVSVANNPSAVLEVYDTIGGKIEYGLNGTTKKIEKKIGSDTIVLTSDNVEVSVMNFYVINTLGGDPSDDSQPRVTVGIEAKPKNGSKTIRAQTTISEKNY